MQQLQLSSIAEATARVNAFEKLDIAREKLDVLSTQTQKFYNDIESATTCPIKYDRVKEPVVTADGHTYEKELIEKYIRQNKIDPLTRKPVSTTRSLRPNLMVKGVVACLDAHKHLLYTDTSL